MSVDYEKMLGIMKTNVKTMTYIDLFEHLELDDYYKTDIHWRQDKIVDIADLLLAQFGQDKKYIMGHL